MTQKRPIISAVLIAMLVFLAIGALPGGWMLIADPTGTSVGFTLDMLTGSPFSSFLVPGLFLFTIIGVWSLLVAGALWRQPPWHWIRALNRRLGSSCVWLAALLQGAILMIWILVQMWALGTIVMLQAFFLGYGILLILIALLPEQRAYYARLAD